MKTRLLKPGFFDDQILSKLPCEAQLLFAGLWCLADREGRLIDVPKKIDATIFPWRDYGARKVDIWLSQLNEHKFIERYEIDGWKYIQIANFLKHQKPHPREEPSRIRANPATANGEPKASPRQAQGKPKANPRHGVFVSVSESVSVSAGTDTPDIFDLVRELISNHPPERTCRDERLVAEALAPYFVGAVNPDAIMRDIRRNHRDYIENDPDVKRGIVFGLIRWIKERALVAVASTTPNYDKARLIEQALKEKGYA